MTGLFFAWKKLGVCANRELKHRREVNNIDRGINSNLSTGRGLFVSGLPKLNGFIILVLNERQHSIIIFKQTEKQMKTDRNLDNGNGFESFNRHLLSENEQLLKENKELKEEEQYSKFLWEDNRKLTKELDLCKSLLMEKSDLVHKFMSEINKSNLQGRKADISNVVDFDS